VLIIAVNMHLCAQRGIDDAAGTSPCAATVSTPVDLTVWAVEASSNLRSRQADRQNQLRAPQITRDFAGRTEDAASDGVADSHGNTEGHSEYAQQATASPVRAMGAGLDAPPVSFFVVTMLGGDCRVHFGRRSGRD
jgi:hypothetical protein